jgi:hypothetical protein
MWIIQEPKKVALWNKRHFEGKNGECAACLKYTVLIFVEKKYMKCNIWRVAVRPSYIWDARFLKVNIPSFSYNLSMTVLVLHLQTSLHRFHLVSKTGISITSGTSCQWLKELNPPAIIPSKNVTRRHRCSSLYFLSLAVHLDFDDHIGYAHRQTL